MQINLNNNLISSICARSLFNSSNSIATAMQRLSTGIRINSAADNAANLSLSKKLDTKISGITVANNNIQTSNSQLQTFSSYLGNMASSLQNVRNLAVQAANGVYSTNERKMINNNAQQLLAGVDQATNQANTEIKAKAVNTVGFLDTVTTITEAQALAAGYNTAHIINNAADFLDKIGADMSGSFILTQDIDMSELGTLGDAAITGIFQGQLDGNGHSVKNLTIDGTIYNNWYIGLFAQLDGAAAVIKNLSVENTNIQANGSDFVGTIAGYLTNGATVTNTYSSGNITGHYYVGGIVGRSASSNITNSYSSTSIDGQEVGGGVLGYSAGSTISNSYSTGNVNINNSYAGGLVGQAATTTIQNSYSTGDVSANNGVAGGLIGQANNNTQIINSYATGNIFANMQRAGGLVGWLGANSVITNSYATGNASSNGMNVGGLVGYKGGGTVQNSYSTGSVSGTSAVGGLIGYNLASGSITNSYATGAANGTASVGGFVGQNLGTITNSYATGSVTSSGTVGGFAGTNTGTIDATNFWDTEKSGQTSSAGSATGLTSKQIDAGEGTTSWDKAIWNLNCGKPELAWDESANVMSVQVNENANSTSKYAMKYLGLDFNVAGGLNIDLTSAEGALSAISIIDRAIEYLSKKQSQVGTNMNSLSGMLNSNSKKHINLVDATSVLRDTDVAVESAKLLQQKIKQSMTTSILQQSKSLDSSSIYQLLNL